MDSKSPSVRKSSNPKNLPESDKSGSSVPPASGDARPIDRLEVGGKNYVIPQRVRINVGSPAANKLSEPQGLSDSPPASQPDVTWMPDDLRAHYKVSHTFQDPENPKDCHKGANCPLRTSEGRALIWRHFGGRDRKRLGGSVHESVPAGHDSNPVQPSKDAVPLPVPEPVKTGIMDRTMHIGGKPSDQNAAIGREEKLPTPISSAQGSDNDRNVHLAKGDEDASRHMRPKTDTEDFIEFIDEDYKEPDPEAVARAHVRSLLHDPFENLVTRSGPPRLRTLDKLLDTSGQRRVLLERGTDVPDPDATGRPKESVDATGDAADKKHVNGNTDTKGKPSIDPISFYPPNDKPGWRIPTHFRGTGAFRSKSGPALLALARSVPVSKDDRWPNDEIGETYKNETDLAFAIHQHVVKFGAAACFLVVRGRAPLSLIDPHVWTDVDNWFIAVAPGSFLCYHESESTKGGNLISDYDFAAVLEWKFEGGPMSKYLGHRRRRKLLPSDANITQLKNDKISAADIVKVCGGAGGWVLWSLSKTFTLEDVDRVGFQKDFMLAPGMVCTGISGRTNGVTLVRPNQIPSEWNLNLKERVIGISQATSKWTWTLTLSPIVTGMFVYFISPWFAPFFLLPLIPSIASVVENGYKDLPHLVALIVFITASLWALWHRNQRKELKERMERELKESGANPESAVVVPVRLAEKFAAIAVCFSMLFSVVEASGVLKSLVNIASWWRMFEVFSRVLRITDKDDPATIAMAKQAQIAKYNIWVEAGDDPDVAYEKVTKNVKEINRVSMEECMLAEDLTKETNEQIGGSEYKAFIIAIVLGFIMIVFIILHFSIHTQVKSWYGSWKKRRNNPDAEVVEIADDDDEDKTTKKAITHIEKKKESATEIPQPEAKLTVDEAIYKLKNMPAIFVRWAISKGITQDKLEKMTPAEFKKLQQEFVKHLVPESLTRDLQALRQFVKDEGIIDVEEVEKMAKVLPPYNKAQLLKYVRRVLRSTRTKESLKTDPIPESAFTEVDAPISAWVARETAAVLDRLISGKDDEFGEGTVWTKKDRMAFQKSYDYLDEVGAPGLSMFNEMRKVVQKRGDMSNAWEKHHLRESSVELKTSESNITGQTMQVVAKHGGCSHHPQCPIGVISGSDSCDTDCQFSKCKHWKTCAVTKKRMAALDAKHNSSPTPSSPKSMEAPKKTGKAKKATPQKKESKQPESLTSNPLVPCTNDFVSEATLLTRSTEANGTVHRGTAARIFNGVGMAHHSAPGDVTFYEYHDLAEKHPIYTAKAEEFICNEEADAAFLPIHGRKAQQAIHRKPCLKGKMTVSDNTAATVVVAGNLMSSGWIVSTGKIGEFTHNMSTRAGSSGAPIVSGEKNQLIGIHNAGGVRGSNHFIPTSVFHALHMKAQQQGKAEPKN